MKENPAMKKVLDNMKPGVISLHGFLGEDKRSLDQIIDHDGAELERLGLTAEDSARVLREIMEKALEGFGEYVAIAEGLSAKADSIRGKLPCPFPHPGLYRKTVVTLRDEEAGAEILYTALGIHLIEEHCFFQGKGSPFRVEPASLAGIMRKLV